MILSLRDIEQIEHHVYVYARDDFKKACAYIHIMTSLSYSICEVWAKMIISKYEKKIEENTKQVRTNSRKTA